MKLRLFSAVLVAAATLGSAVEAIRLEADSTAANPGLDLASQVFDPQGSVVNAAQIEMETQLVNDAIAALDIATLGNIFAQLDSELGDDEDDSAVGSIFAQTSSEQW